MKQIIINESNLKEEEINKTVLRAKLLIINSKDEILLGYGYNNYQILGGHLEENETFDECIVREIKEEAGITIKEEKRSPILTIIYMCKDYPNIGDNTKFLANYYIIKSDLKPNLEEVNLTENELEGLFELRYIHKDKIIEELNNSLKTCSNENVVKDTIEVIKEYLNIDL